MSSREKAGLPASGMALIVANLLPLAGVLFAGWDVLNVVLLYWVETAVIGLVNVLRILTAGGDYEGMGKRILSRWQGRANASQLEEMKRQLDGVPSGLMHGAKLFMVPFFCVHFGMFMFVHLVFIFVLLGRDRGSIGAPFEGLGRVYESLTPFMWLTVLGLLASHLYSYFVNYIGKGEYRATTPPEQMGRPYARVVVMHIAILFGAFASLMLGSGMGVLLLLVGGKTIIDLKLHLREHRLAQAKVSEQAVF